MFAYLWRIFYMLAHRITRPGGCVNLLFHFSIKEELFLWAEESRAPLPSSWLCSSGGTSFFFFSDALMPLVVDFFFCLHYTILNTQSHLLLHFLSFQKDFCDQLSFDLWILTGWLFHISSLHITPLLILCFFLLFLSLGFILGKVCS